MRTKDKEFVEFIMRHPDIYPFISDDGCPPSSEFNVGNLTDDDRFYFISPNEHTLFANYPINTITWEIHTCILKQGRGKAAMESAQSMLEYMFTRTPCRKLISWVPAFNKPALRFAISNGMAKEGEVSKMFLKDGESYDVTLVGLTKKEWICQQQQ